MFFDNLSEQLTNTSQRMSREQMWYWYLANPMMTDALMWVLYWAQVDQTGKVNILSSGMERLSERDQTLPAMYWNMSLALSFTHSS